jgi:hypothetical protein
MSCFLIVLPNVIMLSVVILSVLMLNVVMLNVVAPKKHLDDQIPNYDITMLNSLSIVLPISGIISELYQV